MLRLDLAGLSDFELKRIVTERCSECGSVERVNFYRAPDHPDHIVALIDMSSEEELIKVLAQLDGYRFGDSALIRLEQLPNG